MFLKGHENSVKMAEVKNFFGHFLNNKEGGE
jgi:hypothetical protein